MTNISKVAELAGVSKSTVSRVLNGKANVNEKTKQKVLQAIEQLNYVPNASARALSLRKTNSIGIVLERLHDPFFSELIRGIGEKGEAEKFDLIYCDGKGDLEIKNRYIEYLTHGLVDGIIIFGSYLKDEELIRQLVNRHYPFVLIENELNDVQTNSILLDNVGAAMGATEHLLNLGHERIAHITGNMNTKAALDRLNGYILTMQRKGILIAGDYVAYNYGNSKFFEEGYESMKKLLALPEIPTAVVISDQVRAFGAVRAIQEAGLSVPDDIAVVSFDDRIYYDRYYTGPELTAMQLPLYEMGKEAVKVLVQAIQDPSIPPARKVFETHLLVRESCGAKKSL
jgi:LacI family transcriptional regulator